MSQIYDYDKEFYYAMTIVYDAKSKLYEATFLDLRGFEKQYGKTEEEAFSKALVAKKEWIKNHQGQ